MAYEIPVDVTRVEALTKAFLDAGAAVDGLDAKVNGLNGTMGVTRTLGGRVVQAARNPADSGESSSGIGPRTSRVPFPGERDYIGPERGVFRSRGYFEGELNFIGPERAPAQPRGRAPFAGENDFIGPLPAQASPEVRERVTRGGRSVSLDPYQYEGPRQRLDRERALLNLARATGNEALAKDWEDRVARSQAAVDRADGKRSFADVATNALLRSRVNLGPLSPLVMDLVGGSGAAAGAALGAAGIGLNTIQMAYDRSRQSTSAFYSLGGNPANVGAALALGGDNAEAKALQLGDRLREGTIGAAYLRSQGVEYRGRNTDFSGNYVRAIDALARIPDVQERIRVARETGLGEDAWLADVPKNLRDQLARSRGDAGSQRERTETATQRAEREISNNWWSNQISAVGNALYNTFLNVANPWGLNPDEEKKPDNKRPKPQRHGWENVPRPMSTGPESINGTLNGSISAGWRGRILDQVLDNEGVMVGGFTI